MMKMRPRVIVKQLKSVTARSKKIMMGLLFVSICNTAAYAATHKYHHRHSRYSAKQVSQQARTVDIGLSTWYGAGFNGRQPQAVRTTTRNKNDLPIDRSLLRYARPGQLGVASWYGPGFHSHKTASGERYNMFAMTAASRSLPLLSYARVTDVRTGRHITVKINDRGPYVGGRIIDLSYAAAKQLGIVNRGTAMVKVEPVAQPDIDV